MVLEFIEEGVGFFNAAGRSVHLNRAMLQVITTGPDGARLAGELRRVVERCSARLNAAVPPVREERLSDVEIADVPLGVGHCRLRASPYPVVRGDPPMILVTLRRLSPEEETSAAMRRFDLSPRESRVAGLLAEGMSNGEIAATLHISPATARNHTQRVLQKLGVNSRAQVGALLRHHK